MVGIGMRKAQEYTYSGDIVPVIPEDMVPLFHDVNRVKLVKNLSF
jgi:hypothetical protein